MIGSDPSSPRDDAPRRGGLSTSYYGAIESGVGRPRTVVLTDEDEHVANRWLCPFCTLRECMYSSLYVRMSVRISTFYRWMFVGVAATAFLVLTSSTVSVVTQSTARTATFSSVEPLSLSASNEYGDTKAGKFAYPFLDNALLAEPYKTATFDVENAMSGCEYTWSITQLATGDVIDSGISESSSFSSSAFKSVGEYTLSIAENNCDDDSYARTSDTTVNNEMTRAVSSMLLTRVGCCAQVWVKYVRRELSTLTVSDREAFLDAFSTLWKVQMMQLMSVLIIASLNVIIGVASGEY
jgi:hypothetical protein